MGSEFKIILMHWNGRRLEGGRQGEVERRRKTGRERGNREALHLKSVSKYKMETKWPAFSIAGKDVELEVDQTLASSATEEAGYILGAINGRNNINLEEEIHYPYSSFYHRQS